MDLFKNFTSKEAQSIDFELLTDMIRQDEELKKNTQLYRDLMAQGNEKAAKAVKESTPQVAVSFRMDGGKGKDVLHNCYKTTRDEFGVWMPQRSGNALKTEVIAKFLKTKTLQYDVLTQKTRQMTDEEQELWRVCFPKWFVAMVAGWMDDQTVNHQVIVLVGRQGIYKSTWINRLLPPELQAYSTDHVDIDRLDKDEELRAAEYGLVNIDELDKLTDRQLNKLKSMITTQHVDVRAPFGRHKEKRVRVATYAASGNKEEFLTDQTGNRRWLPFHVVAIDSPYTHQMPYAGMYAQARYLLENGFNYWFDEADIHALEQHVDTFMIPTSEEELIPIYYSPAKLEDAGSVFLTLAEISAKISTYGNLKKNPDPRRLGAIMTKLGFKKERKGHNNRRGYYVIQHSEAEIERMRQPDIF